ncbi:hypothetical protein SPRG_00447 [Saprolegnia parasitica CBS 223.65]|uniref:Uncharacterized protein n=1 Tax=Saprolegnia parasitica (strain CBS 223.65) TaxID=695850 RepID=A0A067CY21_SAPPC|nr:hypothetical protein SPRG_00447 [Saprolegnia parasitica CBS 223.65]KDO35604.1 hypothetical protein SPRG_00447 [Saprolegnia parasitica CBS 223.65]|eukprot:XP_012193933.1 hypothetical protein SPRG_00447 [Saprolegnia parasitica CBS 223.65]
MPRHQVLLVLCAEDQECKPLPNGVLACADMCKCAAYELCVPVALDCGAPCHPIMQCVYNRATTPVLPLDDATP